MQSHSPYGSLQVRVALADALLANVSAGLGRNEVEGLLDCGFSATLAAVRSTHELPDFRDFPGRRAL